VHGIHSKLIELLQDLHTGTQAAVKMDGELSGWFDVGSGVRQGCVIAPLLFNVYMDFVAKQALARMPEGCGVKLAYRGVEGDLFPKKPGMPARVFLVSKLLYADDMVLLSSDAEELAVMLRTMDTVMAEMGMCINAAKTEIMVLDAAAGAGNAAAAAVADPVTVEISGGEVNQVSLFKYVGSMLEAGGGLETELGCRRGKALASFEQFKRLWGVQSLSLKTKVLCYRVYILPVLMFGSETWALTTAQTLMLERVHTRCLRDMMGVTLADRHTNAHVREVCGIPSLAALLRNNRLRWLGHVARMEEGRLPQVALFSSLHFVFKRPCGRPRMRWEDCLKKDLEVLLGACDWKPRKGVSSRVKEWVYLSQLRGPWRARLWALLHPGETQGMGVASRHGRAATEHADCYAMPFCTCEEGSSIELLPTSGRVIERHVPIPYTL
jgi:hypothetical protein